MRRQRFNSTAWPVSLDNGFVSQGRLDGPCGQPAVLQERVDNVDCGMATGEGVPCLLPLLIDATRVV